MGPRHERGWLTLRAWLRLKTRGARLLLTPPPPRLCSCIPPEGRIGPRHGRGWAEAARLVEHENERRTDELEDERRTAELEDERRRDGGRR